MRVILLLVTALVCLSVPTQQAHAIREFKKAFEQHYFDGDEHSDEVRKMFRKAKCNLCHVQGEKKEVNNEYGEALDELIEGNAEDRLKAAKEAGTRDDELKQVLAEFVAAVESVESLPSPSGGTFGDRIREGKLPVELPADEDEAATARATEDTSQQR